jgi:triacylglycerol lipase
VLLPRLSPTEGIARRAAQLKAVVDKHSPEEPVHLVAHSMGRLDSRYMISKLGMAGRVLSLTTLGTPHRGTAFADWGVHRVERLVQPIFDLLGMSRQAFHDLTRPACEKFNQEVLDAPGVRYFSVAGRFVPDWRQPEWQLSYQIIDQIEGPSDGLVSVASAEYGEESEVWEADHASLVNRTLPTALVRGGWPNRLPQYAALMGRLADLGF